MKSRNWVYAIAPSIIALTRYIENFIHLKATVTPPKRHFFFKLTKTKKWNAKTTRYHRIEEVFVKKLILFFRSLQPMGKKLKRTSIFCCYRNLSFSRKKLYSRRGINHIELQFKSVNFLKYYKQGETPDNFKRI